MAKRFFKKKSVFKNYETIKYGMDLGSDDENLSEIKKRLILRRKCL